MLIACSISDDGIELRVNVAQAHDTAIYSCVARNVAGELEKNFNVDVHRTFHISHTTLTDTATYDTVSFRQLFLLYTYHF